MENSGTATPLKHYWHTSDLRQDLSHFGQTSKRNSQLHPKGSKLHKPIHFQFQVIEGTKSFQPLNGRTLMTTIFFEEHSDIWQYVTAVVSYDSHMRTAESVQERAL